MGNFEKIVLFRVRMWKSSHVSLMEVTQFSLVAHLSLTGLSRITDGKIHWPNWFFTSFFASDSIRNFYESEKKIDFFSVACCSLNFPFSLIHLIYFCCSQINWIIFKSIFRFSTFGIFEFHSCWYCDGLGMYTCNFVDFTFNFRVLNCFSPAMKSFRRCRNEKN